MYGHRVALVPLQGHAYNCVSRSVISKELDQVMGLTYSSD
jgi:hypothetical protein